MSRKSHYHYSEDFHEDPNFVMNARQHYFFNKFSSACHAAGSSMISTKYIGKDLPLWFQCKYCGKPHYNTWNNLRNGKNLDFLCPHCMPFVSPSISLIRGIFAERGAFLVTDIYINNAQKLYFLCAQCGKMHSISWKAFLRGENRHLLCALCLALSRYNSSALTFNERNTEFGGRHWFGLGRQFFNVRGASRVGLCSGYSEKYTFHHLYPYRDFYLLRSSVTNGYPVLTQFHKDTSSGLFKTIHSKYWHNPESWNTDEFQNKFPSYYKQLKLSFHNYPGFQFYDLTKFLVTETYLDETPSEEIRQHEQYWKSKGVIYIPFSYREYVLKDDRDRLFNQIRDELKQFIPEIYQYTGAKETK